MTEDALREAVRGRRMGRKSNTRGVAMLRLSSSIKGFFGSMNCAIKTRATKAATGSEREADQRARLLKIRAGSLDMAATLR